MKPLNIFTLAVALVAPSPTRTPTEPMQNSSLVSLYDQYLGPSATQQVLVPAPTATGTERAPDEGVVVDELPQEVLDAAEALKSQHGNITIWDCVPLGGLCTPWLLPPPSGISPPPPPPWERCCVPLTCYYPPGSFAGRCGRRLGHGIP